MTHSWLITGPPGSGRSNLAYAFATALLSPGTAEGDEATARQVAARTHPDLGVLATEGVIIKMEDVRKIVASSQFSPSLSRYRVMVIEDADRMVERTSNVLLKALEEPPPRTVWILCAPSEADLIPTIRSRVRTVRLRVPSAEQVAELLVRRSGVDPASALRAARESQSHIGMAQRLATNADARQRRSRTLQLALGISSVSDAVLAAATLLELAADDAKAITQERDAEERANALRSLGVEPGGTIPAALRSQLKAMEDDQKRRATRSLRDGIDRILVECFALAVPGRAPAAAGCLDGTGEPRDPPGTGGGSGARDSRRNSRNARRDRDRPRPHRRQRVTRPRPRVHAHHRPTRCRRCANIRHRPRRRGPQARAEYRGRGSDAAGDAHRLCHHVLARTAIENLDADHRKGVQRPHSVLQASAALVDVRFLPVHGCHRSSGLERSDRRHHQPRADSQDSHRHETRFAPGQPGRPGASGYDFIRDSLSYAVSTKLQSGYDIVGFDPRGVNHSTAVKCYNDPKKMDAYHYNIAP